MISPAILFNLVTGAIGAFQYFTQAYVVSEGTVGRGTGAVGGTQNSLLFYGLSIYNQAFRYFQLGYASAMAWVLMLIILATTACCCGCRAGASTTPVSADGRRGRAGPRSASDGARKIRWSHVATYVALVGLAATFLAPLVWMLSTSLKTGPQAIATPPVWLPEPVVWGNYPDGADAASTSRSRSATASSMPSRRSSGPSCRAASWRTGSPGSDGPDATSSS